ncbi:GntR family transcriptional regulator [Streptomyces sp. NPDC102467]|uniref:GntR family transcriptional regulator n=1 Tax=Streptomyces sp. NPDC102467 TaxID=3366179 RepID=UPI003822AAA6
MGTKYEEVAADLRRRINSGEFPAGSTLPGYSELKEQYGADGGQASQATIRAALDLLEGEGLVRPVKRLGIVVRDPGERRRIQRGSQVTRNPASGYVFPAAKGPDEKWAPHGRPHAAHTAIPDAVAERLGIEPGTMVMRRRRVMSPVGEPPFQIADAWIHPDVLAEAPQAGEPSTGPGGYLDRIEEAGHGPLEWEEVTRARMPSREEAKLLEMPTSMPVLETTTTGTSARTGQAVEVSVRVIPADRAEIVSKLQRGAGARWPVQPAQPAQ